MFRTSTNSSKETSTVERTTEPEEGQRRFITVAYPAMHLSVPLTECTFQIGRTSEDNQLALDDERASRKHAELVRVKTDVNLLAVADLGSKNGTFLNGVQIQREILRGCAVIRIDETLIVVNEIRPPPDNTTPPPELGNSMALTYAEYCAAVAAGTPLPVLITGPSGAGKDRLAKRIHRRSGRQGPLISVNCATLPSELLASELFGHKKGAFSGADSSRDGLFVTAQNGTLFLDEIADLPFPQQAALLRALQDKRIKPLGADHEIAVDVRIIAATHRDLRALVEKGEFRGDLYARLAGITISLPGLADRREDILPLFRMFLEEDLPLSPDAAEALLLYNWPFNVRELQHAAQRARAFAKHAGRVDLGLLPTEIQSARTQSASVEITGVLGKRQLIALLKEHRGNITNVAKAVGQTRQQIYRRLRLLDINPTTCREG